MAGLVDPIAIERQTMRDIADAIRTRTAQGGGGDAVPTGQIITMMGRTAPTGYLACDGTVYNIADYIALAAYFAAQFEAANYFGGDGETTFAVPDLRGEFLRGAGTNGHENQGSGADVGVHQDATWNLIVSYGGSVSNEAFFLAVPPEDKDKWVTGVKNADAVFRADSGYAYVRMGTSKTSTGDTSYAHTSRPTNTSVLYCIKT